MQTPCVSVRNKTNWERFQVVRHFSRVSANWVLEENINTWMSTDNYKCEMRLSANSLGCQDSGVQDARTTAYFEHCRASKSKGDFEIVVTHINVICYGREISNYIILVNTIFKKSVNTNHVNEKVIETCDAIKQNESELEKDNNSVLSFIVCHTFRAMSH